MNKEKLEILISSKEYLNRLILGIENMVKKIQKGNEIEAMKDISFIADGIDYIIKIVSLTKDIQKNAIDINKLNANIKDILEAFENEDMVLLGDLFNYEVLPILRDIYEKIVIIIEK